MIKNQKGLSLIQVLMLAGIGIIISAVVSTLAINTAKTANTIEGRTNLKIFGELIGDILASPDGCQIQGSSLPFNAALAQEPAGPTTVNPFPSATSQPGLPISFDFTARNMGANVGEGYTAPVQTALKMTINYFRLHNSKLIGAHPTKPGVQIYSAELWMQADRTSEGFGSKRFKPFSMGALSVEVAGGNMTACSKVSSHPFVQCGVQGKIYVGPSSAATPVGITPDANGCAPLSNFAEVVTGPPTFAPGPGPGPKPSDLRLKYQIKKFNDELWSRR